MENKIIARKIMLIAKSLISYDKAQIAQDVAAVKKAKDDFEKKHKSIYIQLEALQGEIDKIEERKKTLEKELKANFNIFDKEIGIKALSKQAASALAEGMKLGENMEEVIAALNSIQEGIASAEISQKPSYKAAWEVLISMLNGTEYDIYVKALDGLFKKNIAEIKTANKLFDSTANSFNGDFEKVYNERKKEWDARHPEKPMPELSKLSSSCNQIRVAGIMSWFGDFTGWITKKYHKIVDVCSSAIKNLFGLQKDTEKLNNKFEALLKAAKKVESEI